MKTLPVFFLISSLVLFTRCEKEAPLYEPENPDQPNGYPIDKGTSVTASFSGKITDEVGNAVQAARIIIGSSETFTDVDGFFFVKDAAVFSNHGYVRVEASGYFHGSRSVLPKPGVNHINITLLSNVAMTTFPSHTGGIATDGGSKIEFGPGFIDGVGNPYAGDVYVAIKYLDPEAENLNEIMPGDLIAGSKEGTKMLESFGMVAVELTTAGGSKLQLAEGNEAILHMGLSFTALNKAPEELPLWYFDETRGHWVEEGKAQLVQNEYVGKVKHFSFWNCDVPRNYSRIDGLVKTNTGELMAGVDIEISSQLMGKGHCYTSSQGAFGGRVPSGELFDLTLSYMSATGIKSLSLGPFSSDQVLADIVLGDIPGFISLSGKYIDCDNQPLASGRLFLNDQTTINIVNGEYSFRYPANLPFTLRPSDNTYVGSKKSFTGFLSDGVLPLDSFCKKNSPSIPYTYEIRYELDNKTTIIRPEVQSGTFYHGTSDYIHFGRHHSINGVTTGDFQIVITNYNGPGEYTVRNQNNDFLWIGNFKGPNCSHADSIHVKVNEWFVKTQVFMDLEFSGTVNVWNDQLKVFEKKELKNGSLIYHAN